MCQETEWKDSYYRNDPKFSDRQVWANSADPEHTADQHLDFAIPSASFEHITLW